LKTKKIIKCKIKHRKTPNKTQTDKIDLITNILNKIIIRMMMKAKELFQEKDLIKNLQMEVI